MIAALAISVSLIGLFMVMKTLFFCIKRYILYFFNVNTDLTSLSFSHTDDKSELSPSEIVRKTRLKERIELFAKETCEMLKDTYLGHGFDDEFSVKKRRDFNLLSNVYKRLSEMPVNTAAELEEVEFLFNDGKLRSDDEIKDFYEDRKRKDDRNSYRETNFVVDFLRVTEESELSIKLITGLSLMVVSGLYFYIKICHPDVFPWTVKDIGLFIIETYRGVFDPYYDTNASYTFYIERGDTFFFDLSLLLSIIIAFIVGGGANLLVGWLKEGSLSRIYERAGEKKKVNLILGVNTASYLYVLHKLLKRKKR